MRLLATTGGQDGGNGTRGGVYVYKGTFDMRGGEVSGNTTGMENCGSGADVSPHGTFNMYNGTITGDGVGAVYVCTNGSPDSPVTTFGKFTMEGGQVTGKGVPAVFLWKYGTLIVDKDAGITSEGAVAEVNGARHPSLEDAIATANEANNNSKVTLLQSVKLDIILTITSAMVRSVFWLERISPQERKWVRICAQWWTQRDSNPRPLGCEGF